MTEEEEVQEEVQMDKQKACDANEHGQSLGKWNESDQGHDEDDDLNAHKNQPESDKGE